MICNKDDPRPAARKKHVDELVALGCDGQKHRTSEDGLAPALASPLGPQLQLLLDGYVGNVEATVALLKERNSQQEKKVDRVAHLLQWQIL
jgi:hypothetical protein